MVKSAAKINDLPLQFSPVFSSSSLFLAFKKTVAPEEAHAVATALQIPADAPVINIVLLFNVIISIHTISSKGGHEILSVFKIQPAQENPTPKPLKQRFTAELFRG